MNREPLPIHPTQIPNLDLVPSHIWLSETDVILTTAIDHREGRLKSQLDKAKAAYDFVFIDCPPALGWLTVNAFTASDEIIVVVSPGYFELDSTVQIMRTIKEVEDFFNPALRLRGFLFNMSDSTVNCRTSLQLLRQTYPEHVLNTIIPRNVALKDASFEKKDIYTYAPDSVAAQAYLKLIKEVFNG